MCSCSIYACFRIVSKVVQRSGLGFWSEVRSGCCTGQNLVVKVSVPHAFVHSCPFPRGFQVFSCLVDRHGGNMADVACFHRHSCCCDDPLQLFFFSQAKPTTCLIHHREQMMSTFLRTFLSADRHGDTSRSVAADKRASTWTVDKR